MTRSTRTLFLLLAAALAVPSVSAQPAEPSPAAPPPAGAAAAPSTTLPSVLFAPAVVQVRQALTVIRPDKWKIPGPVSEETVANIGSIQHDLDYTLPGLFATADSNPASVSEVLPTYRNVEALYEVLLRVTEISTLAAPAQQSVALQQALIALETSRRTLGDQLQASAINQAHAIVALQGDLRTSQAAVVAAKAAVPACPPPPAPAKRRTSRTSRKPTQTH